MTVGDRIKSRRIELKLTMADVAKAVGISEGTVSRWESGNIVNLKRSRISALAKTLQISTISIINCDENAINDSVGNRIKTRRLELNLTLEDVANYLNTTKQTIQKYESGIISNIPSNKIEKMAEVLETTPSWLMRYSEQIEQVSKEHKKLIDVYEKLNETGKKEAIKRIRELGLIEHYTLTI